MRGLHKKSGEQRKEKRKVFKSKSIFCIFILTLYIII